METLEKTLHLNRDWALKRIHTLCESSDNKDVIDGYAIAIEYLEWFEPTYTSYLYNLRQNQMTNAHSKEFLKTIDEQIKRLRDEGKLDEANSLQLTYFPSVRDTK